jgi:Bardet-Biedl syndrome 2 protein
LIVIAAFFVKLLVGSEDFQIRAFKQDEILSEILETDSVTNLAHLGDTQFGYSLANGTVGIYDRSQRWWRIKVITCLFFFPPHA